MKQGRLTIDGMEYVAWSPKRNFLPPQSKPRMHIITVRRPSGSYYSVSLSPEIAVSLGGRALLMISSADGRVALVQADEGEENSFPISNMKSCPRVTISSVASAIAERRKSPKDVSFPGKKTSEEGKVAWVFDLWKGGGR